MQLRNNCCLCQLFSCIASVAHATKATIVTMAHSNMVSIVSMAHAAMAAIASMAQSVLCPTEECLLHKATSWP